VILCVAPNPSIDKTFEVECLEPGAIHRPTAFVQVPGGKGLNVARAAASLGADVHIVALLGGHAGRWIADELGALGIPLTAVWRAAETRSCLSVADTHAHSLTEFYESGPPVAAGEWTEFVRVVHERAMSATWTTVSGSLPPEAPVTGYRELVATANVAADSLVLGEARPAVLKVNLAEARALTGSNERSAEALASALRQQIGGDGHAVVVTAGTDGAALVTPDGEPLRGTLAIAGDYAVGSGDAFLAGLVVALDRGQSWADALRAALGAGAANAEIPGAGRLDRDRVKALAERAEISIH
jgi:1-phosphofructokinase family hexose kinase